MSTRSSWRGAVAISFSACDAAQLAVQIQMSCAATVTAMHMATLRSRCGSSQYTAARAVSQKLGWWASIRPNLMLL